MESDFVGLWLLNELQWGGFLKDPAIDDAARALAKDQDNALAGELTGRTISHYRIVEKIGQGGMGEVFLAEDTSLHRKVALKFLPPEMQQDPVARKRFLREAHSAAALDNPYICSIHEVGEFEGKDFIVMEYVDGQMLMDRLRRGQLPLKQVLQIAAEVAEALEAAHGKGIIHRDLKPANIMLAQTGHAAEIRRTVPVPSAAAALHPHRCGTGPRTRNSRRSSRSGWRRAI